tara:strand:- start:426 stop:968 length:543 start_codon:yes stop_codon:yes gene_type:complete
MEETALEETLRISTNFLWGDGSGTTYKYSDEKYTNAANEIKDILIDAMKSKSSDLITKTIGKPSQGTWHQINYLFDRLDCLMSGLDKHGKEDVSNGIIKELKESAKKNKDSPVAKKIGSGWSNWLTRRSTKWKRGLMIIGECKESHGMYSDAYREEMPAYLLNAITKEKPVHPVYGKLRY